MRCRSLGRGTREGGEEDYPALVVRGTPDGGAHHLFALYGDDGVVLLAGGEDLGERVDGLHIRCLERFPQVQDPVEIGRVKIPDPPVGHVVSPGWFVAERLRGICDGDPGMSPDARSM